MKKIVSLFFFLCSSSFPVDASSLTGTALVEECEKEYSFICLGYIGGVLDTIMIANDFFDICFPQESEFNFDETISLLKQYIAKHPDEGVYSAAFPLSMALALKLGRGC